MFTWLGEKVKKQEDNLYDELYRQMNSREEDLENPEKSQDKPVTRKAYIKGIITGMGVMLVVFLAVLCVQKGMALYTQKQLLKEVKQESETADTSSITDRTIQKLKVIESTIDMYYYKDEIDLEAMEDGLYQGMIESLNDPYSTYYSPEEVAKANEKNEGIYYGIGAYVSLDTNYSRPKLSGIIPNTPAEEAGLRENDVLVSIDGQSTYNLSLEEAVALIRGEEGTTVELSIFRDGESDYLDITVERRKVESQTVSSEVMDGDIGYIRITNFEAVTVGQFQSAYDELQSRDIKGLIIDVRSNPGGLLTSVNDIARQILPEGVIVYTEDKYGNRQDYTCDGANEIDIPLVVLVNGNSASASEILSGAVKDYGIGTLVGTTTYGKGVVQNTFGLTDGSAVKLTISNYFTPNGNNINGVGIEPDEVVELDAEAYYADGTDNQLNRGLEILQEQIAAEE